MTDKRHILLVEDNADNQQLATWILEDAGYTVECASTAEEGIAFLETGATDMVLMDISLPGMDGKQATQKLRQDPRFADLPIVALTAHAVYDEREAIKASGVNCLLTKPIDEDELLRTLSDILQN